MSNGIDGIGTSNVVPPLAAAGRRTTREVFATANDGDSTTVTLSGRTAVEPPLTYGKPKSAIDNRGVNLAVLKPVLEEIRRIPNHHIVSDEATQPGPEHHAERNVAFHELVVRLVGTGDNITAGEIARTMIDDKAQQDVSFSAVAKGFTAEGNYEKAISVAKEIGNPHLSRQVIAEIATQRHTAGDHAGAIKMLKTEIDITGEGVASGDMVGQRDLENRISVFNGTINAMALRQIRSGDLAGAIKTAHESTDYRYSNAIFAATAEGYAKIRDTAAAEQVKDLIQHDVRLKNRVAVRINAGGFDQAA